MTTARSNTRSPRPTVQIPAPAEKSFLNGVRPIGNRLDVIYVKDDPAYSSVGVGRSRAGSEWGAAGRTLQLASGSGGNGEELVMV